jgi:nitrite reductase/ring-hydroxylating ferredoxin subunit
MSIQQAQRPAKQTVAVGFEDSFQVGKFVIMTVADQEIGVVRLQSGELRAVRNWCPHKGAPICRGIVGGTWPPSEPGRLSFERAGEVLVCPWHGYEYDLNTGKEMFQPVPTRLRMYPVSVENGQVFVTV